MIRIGIICPSEIASRRFIPSIKKLEHFVLEGIAYANYSEWSNATEDVIDNEKRKAEKIAQENNIKVYDGYSNMISSDYIDAIYLPLPPALHFEWAKAALLAGKHVFLEKPATIRLETTLELIKIAKEKKLALHENYMFKFHDQISVINGIIRSGAIGNIRLFRISFGFPKRPENDIRYNKGLGGGALLDCGGYTLKYAEMLLGEKTVIESAQANFVNGYDVDIYGSGVVMNEEGLTVQVAFGMDNAYRCELEVWGSKGILETDRVLTAPVGFAPKVKLIKDKDFEVLELPSDDAFQKSSTYFHYCTENSEIRHQSYEEIKRQAILVNQFQKKAKLL